MPSELLAGRADSILAVLLGVGVEVNYRRRSEVCEYIAQQRPARRVTAATSTGWLGANLLVMTGQNIGTGHAILQGESASARDYGQGGTLAGWTEGIRD